jgi:uncharacterized phiE125 gp8 family phage protein
MYLGRMKLKTAPTEEIVATIDLKENCRVDYTSTDEDDYMDDVIQEVRVFSETALNRAFLTQSWYYIMDTFPGEDFIELPRVPLQLVNSITYTDYNNDASTLTTDYYNYDVTDNIIYLEYGQSWPNFTEKPHGAVVIDFTAGSTSVASFKEDNFDIYQWNLATAAKLFDNRELTLSEIPFKMPKRNLRFR